MPKARLPARRLILCALTLATCGLLADTAEAGFLRRRARCQPACQPRYCQPYYYAAPCQPSYPHPPSDPNQPTEPTEPSDPTDPASPPRPALPRLTELPPDVPAIVRPKTAKTD
jgi:hypothetical protein